MMYKTAVLFAMIGLGVSIFCFSKQLPEDTRYSSTRNSKWANTHSPNEVIASHKNFSASEQKTDDDQQNNPPEVKLTSPKPGTVYSWNSPLLYSISVTDKEDGDSKYEEINKNEVFLEARYYPDSLRIAADLKKPARKDAAGLTLMRGSNCLNCHAFQSPLIGPSYFEISKKYPVTEANIAMLSKKVIDGSSGVWGNIVMPTHPELSLQQTKEIVSWILKNGLRTEVNYYTGAEGSMRFPAPQHAGQKGFLLLTASYTDHGLNGKTGSELRSQDTRIIAVK